MQRKKVGIVSIVIGLLMFIYGGFNYNSTDKKVNASSFNVSLFKCNFKIKVDSTFKQLKTS